MDPSYSKKSPRQEKNMGYTAFLQDQVRRLNAVLKEYQWKYPPIREPSIEENEPLPPWLEDSSLLSPLLIEYDGNIKSLRDQVGFYKKEQELLKEKADKIVEENNRLHEELRRSIENQLDALQQVEGMSGVNQDVIDNMQHQIRNIHKEKENYKSLWEKATKDLNNNQNISREKSQEIAMRNADIAALQDDLRKARKYAEDLQLQKHKLKMEQEQFLQTAESQEKEMQVARDDLRRTKTELKTSKLRNDELKKHLENLQDQIKLLDKGSQKAIGLEKTTENTIRELQNGIFELESRCVSMMKEIDKLRAEKGDMEESIFALRKRSAEFEDREYQATLHVRDSVQLVENALLEKEQAAMKEQQLSKEVERLQESVSYLAKDAEKKKRSELENQKAQHSRQTQRLMEEVHYLEMEGAEKQAQLERALREKTAVERELEKAYQGGPSEASRAGQNIDELQHRLSRVEVSRDDALQQAEQLKSSIKASESQSKSEKSFLNSQLIESKKRIRALEEEVESMSKSKLIFLEEIDKLKRDAISANSQSEEEKVKSTSEVSLLKQKLEVQAKDFECRIKATENLSRQSVDELRNMLTAQQRVGNKWREESKIMSQKFETTVNDLRQENARLQRKTEEISKKLTLEFQRSDKMERDCLTAQASQEKLQRMAADAEARADAASTQVQTLLNRERQLLQERKDLNRRIDQLELEVSRASRQKLGSSWGFSDEIQERDRESRSPNGYFS